LLRCIADDVGRSRVESRATSNSETVISAASVGRRI
jgi:hypothetical protein